MILSVSPTIYRTAWIVARCAPCLKFAWLPVLLDDQPGRALWLGWYIRTAIYNRGEFAYFRKAIV